MQKGLTENASFLKAVICMLAAENYKTEIVDCDMEDITIGPGLEFESKEEYMKITIKEWFEETQETVKVFQIKEEEVTESFKRMSNGFHLLKLGESFKLNDNYEITRVPGGWVFLPYNSEFKL